MEQNNQHGQCMCDMCKGGMMGMYGGHRRWHLLRWILGLVVLWMTFSFGVNFGEFKASIENGGSYYGYGHMRTYGGMPMMYGYDSTEVPITSSAPVGTVLLKK